MDKQNKLYKKALFGSTALFEGIQAAGSMTAIAASYVIAASVIGGGVAGWAAAKLTSKSSRDEDSVKKSYEDKRLSNDIGYLKTKLESEWSNSKRKQATPTSTKAIFR